MRLAIWACEFALYTCLFIGVGGAAFLSWFEATSRTASRLVGSSLLIGLVVTALFVLVQERHSTQAFSFPVRGSGWSGLFSSPEGTTAILAGAALIGGLAALALKNGFGKAFALLALLCTGIALAASGKASAAEPRWMTQPAVFIHVVAIAFWTGALLPLAAVLNSDKPDALVVLRRFSNTIPIPALLRDRTVPSLVANG